MQRYFLRSDAYWCSTDEGITFLNAESGHYFSIPNNAVAALRSSVKGFPAAPYIACIPDTTPEGALEIADALTSKGILTLDEASSKPVETLSIIQTDSLSQAEVEQRVTGAGKLLLATFTLTYAKAAYKYKRYPFKRLIEHARSRKLSKHRPKNQEDHDRAFELASYFRYFRCLLYTSVDRCLFDSFVLVEFLARYDTYPEWVIGARTQPFGAHSWVQAGTTVLNDYADKTRRFAPILVV